MVTSATSAASPPASPAAAAGANNAALSQLSSNFGTFLGLLTTQLKNQDPLSPMDSTQFTQQLTQMSGVQAQLQANALLAQVAANTGTGIATAVGLIGKNVRALSSTADLKAGKAEWTFNVPADATSLKVEVIGANGKVLHAEAMTGANLKAGDHNFTWNGKDMAGANTPDGTYSLKVTALDSAGKTLDSTTYVQGLVTSVEQADGDTLITVNGSKVSWSKVKSITGAATPAPSTAPTSTASTSTASGGS